MNIRYLLNPILQPFLGSAEDGPEKQETIPIDSPFMVNLPLGKSVKSPTRQSHQSCFSQRTKPPFPTEFPIFSVKTLILNHLQFFFGYVPLNP